VQRTATTVQQCSQTLDLDSTKDDSAINSSTRVTVRSAFALAMLGLLKAEQAWSHEDIRDKTWPTDRRIGSGCAA
jgi:hypothetical protein